MGDIYGLRYVEMEERPWGKFYVIDKRDIKLFLDTYFSNAINIEEYQIENLQPKILIVNPGQKLSWQYHQRRKELWSVIDGPVGVIRSYDDNFNPINIHDKNDIIYIDVYERHRLIGLDHPAVIAEIWISIHPNDLSDEYDIIRISDIYSRLY